MWFLQLWHYQGNITWRLRCSSTGPARPVLQFHITACLAIHPVDPANEIMGGRAKDILWELIPFMPKPTSDFYSEALFRCKTHSQLDKALGGLKEILCVCVLVCLVVNLETQTGNRNAQRNKMKCWKLDTILKKNKMLSLKYIQGQTWVIWSVWRIPFFEYNSMDDRSKNVSITGWISPTKNLISIDINTLIYSSSIYKQVFFNNENITNMIQYFLVPLQF